MNVCDVRHEPRYQITYRGARGSKYKQKPNSDYSPVWLVCESCMENKKHFGSEDQVISTEVLA